jgi:hypothetical protein
MKIVKIFSLLIVTALFAACNYNEDNFPGLDDLSRPKNVSSYEYTITSADITTIVNALRANKNQEDSIIANALNSSKTFSSAIPSNRLIPYALKSLYYSADLGSSAKVTFPYSPDREENLDKLSLASYVLNTDDYKQIWGSTTDYVSALTPAKSPATEIPIILAAKKPDAVSGDYAVVQYNYSENEPEVSIGEVKYLFTDFEGIASGSGVATVIDGWSNIDSKGSIFWQTRAYNGNQYSQVSANNSKTENEVWLRTPVIDLTQAINPKFSFDITAGYYNANCLSILVSEFTIPAIAPTWTDISSKFTLPTGPTSGYGTLTSAGEMDCKAYAGKKVSIAFKYTGNGIDNSATTTYQIDNVKLSETKNSVNVTSSVVQYGVYQFDGSTWKAVAASNNISILQPEDYAAMGITNLTTAQAPNYLPVWLTQKFPYAQEGYERTVVFRTSSSANYADKYVFTAGKWISASTTENRTEQYVVSSQGWMFDPTIVLNIKRYVNTDAIQKFIDHVHNNMEGKWYPYPGRINEEHYYGFNAYYGQIAFDNNRTLYGDDEIKNLATNEEKWALFEKRVEEAFPIFASINYPTLQTHVSGVEQLLKVRIEHFFSTSDRRYFEHTLKCIKSGTGTGTPAEYEYVGKEQIPGI